jgi:hypothetical protein
MATAGQDRTPGSRAGPAVPLGITIRLSHDVGRALRVVAFVAVVVLSTERQLSKAVRSRRLERPVVLR